TQHAALSHSQSLFTSLANETGLSSFPPPAELPARVADPFQSFSASTDLEPFTFPPPGGAVLSNKHNITACSGGCQTLLTWENSSFCRSEGREDLRKTLVSSS